MSLDLEKLRDLLDDIEGYTGLQDDDPCVSEAQATIEELNLQLNDIEGLVSDAKYELDQYEEETRICGTCGVRECK